jgi:alkanesulfonate monooxygenase SsuD/methylene tetrahydromethanopterin reductase-like flavin-dependent oxidoreductase (luciferase family)
MKLAILDLSGSIEYALAVAPRAEQLGYTRYWIAENQPQPSPLLFASIVAGQTERIRVGTAGVLLHYYPPLRTAHDFKFLERVFPGRIDAGFCPGLTPYALIAPDLDGRNIAAVSQAYPERAAKLVEFLRSRDPALGWRDAAAEPPAMWSLGGARSGQLAARLGIGFGLSLLQRDAVDDPLIAQRYREQLAPGASPACVVALCVICAPTQEAAEADERTTSESFHMPRVVGTPEVCVAALAEYARRYAVDELVIAAFNRTFEERMLAYELLAEAAGLTSSVAGSDTARSG